MRARTMLVALVAMAALAGGCKGKPEAGGPAGAGSGKAGGRGRGGGGAMAAFPVDVAKVETKKVEYTVTAPGTIDAFERVQVTARVAGTVDKIAFTEGQQLKKGDVLVVVDAERYRLSVNSAKAQLDKAEAVQKDAEGMVGRREGASDKHPGLIPGEEVEGLRAKVLTAKADVAIAREAMRVAQLNLRDASVRAPMDGVIQTRTVETGQYVPTGYVMATLLRNDPLLLRFSVTPQEAPRIKPDMVATFTLRESQRTYSAKITLVSGAADEASHLVAIAAEIVDEDHKYWLRPGSFCDVVVPVGANRDAPVVPRSAVRASERGLVAFVIENGVARERVLTLGMTTADGWVEVRAGLAAGDRLVVRGAEPLADGTKVRESEVTLPPPGSSAPAAAGSAAPTAGSASVVPASASAEAAAGPPAESAGRRRKRGGE